jgi:hypothetical protein
MYQSTRTLWFSVLGGRFGALSRWGYCCGLVCGRASSTGQFPEIHQGSLLEGIVSMRLNLKKVFVLGLLLASINRVSAADIAHLTGVKIFSAGGMAGIFNNTNWYDTVGNNFGFNTYLTGSNTGINGAFVNSGNGASTSVDIPLSIGSYSFWMFNTSESSSYWGLNLFFDSDQVNPRITAITSMKTLLTDPPFQINQALDVPRLDDNILVSSPRSLVYQTNNAFITLTSYSYSDPSVYQMDKVSDRDSISDGRNDSVSFITLTVSSVPEPSTYALATIASVLMALSVRRRNRSKICLIDL